MRKRLEDELYPGVATWLALHLRGKFPRADVNTYDTHSVDLRTVLRQRGLHGRFQDSDAYEIQVDVTGVVQDKDKVRLAFVECKVGPITLGDVGQMLGYCLVALPEWSYLISPAGLSDRLSKLLITYGRYDILSYGKGNHIRIAQWNMGRNEIDVSSLVPRGTHI
jgi:hypothetical protein